MPMSSSTERKNYPIRADDYELLEIIGQGASAYVHRARCIPLDEIIAIKILDFERQNCDLNVVSREAKTMLLIDHPNVLKAHCSFVNDHNLWVVMPYMAGGSCLHIMKSAFPNGFREVIIASVLREVLRGLEYLHQHGHIHRDVKVPGSGNIIVEISYNVRIAIYQAGNILVDSKGGIKLGDFGVSAYLFDSGDRQRSRNTFVGTPCWMAPEVMEQLHGYDFKADIWSFGITALELAHGHAPFSKYPPMKVLLMTLQNAPPGLEDEKDKKFSRSFKQMIAMCLVKDPSKRPSAQKLLKQTFFKQARSQDYITRKILEGLPTLAVRHQALKEMEEDMLAKKKMPEGKKEEISQNEYKRGISGWNFDLEDLRTRASLISDNSENILDKDSGICSSPLFEIDTLQERIHDGLPYATSSSSRDDDDLENDNKSPRLSSPDQSICYQRTRSDGSDHESKAAGSSDQNVLHNGLQFQVNDKENYCSGGCESEIDEKIADSVLTRPSHDRRLSICSSSSEILPPIKMVRYYSSKLLNQQQIVGNCNGDVSQTTTDASSETVPKASKSAASSADDFDDKTKPHVIQQRGRFKVTSEDVDLDKALPPIVLQKSHSMQVISQHTSPTVPSSIENASYGASVYQQLHSVLQSCVLQQDNILALMKQVTAGDLSANRAAEGVTVPALATTTERSLLEASHEREKELIQEVTELQWRVICKEEECQRLKAKLAQV